MFTKQHYKAIAGIIAAQYRYAGQARRSIEVIAESYADYFAKDDPRFDRKCFLSACGIHKCEQCGKPMSTEWFLGSVCGRCCRKNHKQAAYQL